MRLLSERSFPFAAAAVEARIERAPTSGRPGPSPASEAAVPKAIVLAICLRGPAGAAMIATMSSFVTATPTAPALESAGGGQVFALAARNIWR